MQVFSFLLLTCGYVKSTFPFDTEVGLICRKREVNVKLDIVYGITGWVRMNGHFCRTILMTTNPGSYIYSPNGNPLASFHSTIQLSHCKEIELFRHAPTFSIQSTFTFLHPFKRHAFHRSHSNNQTFLMAYKTIEFLTGLYVMSSFIYKMHTLNE